MRIFSIFFLTLIGTFIIDQNIKTIFVEGYFREGSCIDLVLEYNTGVAFSMFSSLGEYLKYIQGLVVLSILFYIFKDRYILSILLCLGY